MVVNLNDITIEGHHIPEDQWLAQEDFGARSAAVRVYFKDLETHLVRHIQDSDLVVGCVAWLTNERILRALSSKMCTLVVQKEDFLRPDAGHTNNAEWKAKLHALYSALREGPERHHYGDTLMSHLCTGSDPTVKPVRCVGMAKQRFGENTPRMHHKFLVFCSVIAGRDEDIVQPYAVWTGSFNPTQNATYSLENAVVLTDPEIVKAFYKEWGQVEALSEQLNWESTWVRPGWRVGT